MTTQLLSGDSQNTSLLSLASDGTQRTGSVDPYGAEPAVNAGTFPLGYTGQRIDPLTGDYPMGNGYRHYSPGMRCFRSQDSWSPFGPGGVNGYAYVGGNPIDHTDPSGHMSVRAGIRIGFGLLRLTIMGAMAIFTGGASLGLVAGESAARRGLRLASGAVRATSAALQIASGATLDGDPELSADLGWAAMATGIVGGITGGIAENAERKNRTGTFNLSDDPATSGQHPIARLPGNEPEQLSFGGKTVLRYSEAPNNNRAIIFSHGRFSLLQAATGNITAEIPDNMTVKYYVRHGRTLVSTEAYRHYHALQGISSENIPEAVKTYTSGQPLKNYSLRPLPQGHVPGIIRPRYDLIVPTDVIQIQGMLSLLHNYHYTEIHILACRALRLTASGVV